MLPFTHYSLLTTHHSQFITCHYEGKARSNPVFNRITGISYRLPRSFHSLAMTYFCCIYPSVILNLFQDLTSLQVSKGTKVTICLSVRFRNDLSQTIHRIVCSAEGNDSYFNHSTLIVFGCSATSMLY